MNTEALILSNLIRNKSYVEQVIPYLRDDYFATADAQIVFKHIRRFYERYLVCPTKAALLTELSAAEGIPEKIHEAAVTLVKGLDTTDQNEQWLVEQTELFCQDRAILNALDRSINISNGDDPKLTKQAIPGLLLDALSVSFNQSIGHDYIEDAEKRYEYYHSTVHKVDFDIDEFNTATRGGFAKKTVNVMLAGTNVGKTLVMCHMASHWLRSGKNVLYITLEMSQEEIGKRIDANLLDMEIGLLDMLTKEQYISRVDKLKQRSLLGKLVIHEYPTGSAGAADFRVLLNNLRLKKGFIPDVVCIDYLNICKSSRMSDVSNSYGYVKAIIEEQRGLAVEFNYCCVTATQTNRSGSKNNDVDMDETSESFGVPMTSDLMWAIMAPEELFDQGYYLFKQLKSRYDNKAKLRRFLVGVDPDRQRLYTADPSAQSKLYENRNKTPQQKQNTDQRGTVEKQKDLLFGDIE